MNKQTLKRLAVKGTVAYVAVFSLVLMVAMPAMALIAAANSVNSRAIINRQVKSRDIAKGAVRTKNIAKRAVKSGKIAKNAVRTKHIKHGAVTAAKINSTGLNADKLDGAHASAFAGAGHNHNSAYAGKNHNHSSVKTGYLSIPVAALTPNENTYEYYKFNDFLFVTSGDFGWFSAPVYLPQGAVVTKLRYYFKDDITIIVAPNPADQAHTFAKLNRVSNFQTSSENMAHTGKSTSQDAWQVRTATSILYPTIDNNANAYYVHVYLSHASVDLQAGNIVIEYTYTSPGS